MKQRLINRINELEAYDGINSTTEAMRVILAEHEASEKGIERGLFAVAMTDEGISLRHIHLGTSEDQTYSDELGICEKVNNKINLALSVIIATNKDHTISLYLFENGKVIN